MAPLQPCEMTTRSHRGISKAFIDLIIAERRFELCSDLLSLRCYEGMDAKPDGATLTI